MKLFFLRPKDKITLLEDGSLENTISSINGEEDYNHPTWDRAAALYPVVNENFIKKGRVSVPSGTEFVVSQIYIRNKGWFTDSINLRVPKEYISRDKYGKTLTMRVLLSDIENWEIEVQRSK